MYARDLAIFLSCPCFSHKLLKTCLNILRSNLLTSPAKSRPISQIRMPPVTRVRLDTRTSLQEAMSSFPIDSCYCPDPLYSSHLEIQMCVNTAHQQILYYTEDWTRENKTLFQRHEWVIKKIHDASVIISRSERDRLRTAFQLLHEWYSPTRQQLIFNIRREKAKLLRCHDQDWANMFGNCRLPANIDDFGIIRHDGDLHTWWEYVRRYGVNRETVIYWRSEFGRI